MCSGMRVRGERACSGVWDQILKQNEAPMTLKSTVQGNGSWTCASTVAKTINGDPNDALR